MTNQYANEGKTYPKWFKLYLKGTVKFHDGGNLAEQNKHMILSQAKEVAHHVSEIQEILAKDPAIDAWVVAKMQDVSTGLSDITHYLDGKSEYANGGEIILGGGSMASVQDSILAKGAKLAKTKFTKSNKVKLRDKLLSLTEERNVVTRRESEASWRTKDVSYAKEILAIDKQINEIQNELGGIYIFDSEKQLNAKSKQLKSENSKGRINNRITSAEGILAKSWRGGRSGMNLNVRIFDYDKFLNSLIEPIHESTFEKLKNPYWQKAWNKLDQ